MSGVFHLVDIPECSVIHAKVLQRPHRNNDAETAYAINSFLKHTISATYTVIAFKSVRDSVTDTY